MFYKVGNIKICVEKDYDAMSTRAAYIFEGHVQKKPGGVFGFATGGTPVGMYKELAEKNKRGELDLSQITTFNLDEYHPIKNDNHQSYRYFMNQHLFDHVNIKETNIHLLNGEAVDASLECKAYEDRIRLAGGIDLQILGIGMNGHIGFNEPDDYFPGTTRLVGLTDSTIDANARFFESRDQVPTHAMSMGVGTIMSARSILMLVTGSNKARIVADMLLGHVKPQVPASILQFHRHVTIVLDEAAAEDIRLMLGYKK
jgi:glucosamine-6-phosphate deaminase